MTNRPITPKKIIEYILWIIAYIPVVMLLALKYIKQRITLNNLIIQISENVSINLMNDKLLYILLFVVTITFYKISNNLLIEKMQEKIDANGTKLFVRKHSQISINEYSFFILSLLLPFLSHNTDNELDLLLAISIIVIIIIILVKKDHIIVNPIFLFSKLNVFTSEIETDNIRKEVYLITLEESLDSDHSFNYVEYFKDIYYVSKSDY